MTIRIALIGNPNVGKSSIFNNITGGRAHVGNWPGKTVEKKEGSFEIDGNQVDIIDLPGTYSLTAQSVDEIVAREFIIGEKPDVVIDIIDASNLERNLYLTLQLLELEVNLVIALNKCDVAESLGYEIDEDKLSKLLGVPVVRTVAPTKEGMEHLKKVAIKAAGSKRTKTPKIKYEDATEKIIFKIVKEIPKDVHLSWDYPKRWLAIKILEGDEIVLKETQDNPSFESVIEIVKSNKTEEVLGDEPEVTLAEMRYEIIDEIIDKTLKGQRLLTMSDLLDNAFLNKYLGIPVFLTLWWALFRFTFDVSVPFSDLIDMIFSQLGEMIGGLITQQQLSSFISDGIFGGLGGVLVFLPPIFFLFLGLAILEDSGYLARAAFVMDRIMHKIGLHGKSFIPMLLGFGCNIPGIMATRTIDREEDRILTILVNPLMSCSARLPVYVLIAGAVLGEYAAAGVYSMYLLGVILAILVAVLFRKTIPYFKGKPAPLILELPQYSAPTIRDSLSHTWERGLLFLKKAGTVILVGVIAVWFLSSYPWEAVHVGDEFLLENSYLAMIGKSIEPIFAPLGFNWMAAVALMFGFIAKEIVVGTFATLFGLQAEGPQQVIPALQASGVFTPLTGLAFMAFTLIYAPCVATIAVIRRETASWKWPLFTVIYGLVLAYAVALAIVGIGGLMGYT
ncbi:MAG: ferrous iron transport protein B [Candidatus Thorarchaeota archaeon]